MFFYLFILVVFIQIGYYVLLLSRFAFAKPENYNKTVIPISLIIACKNEAENLKILVPKLLQQTHSDFEIILVNDASTDNTQTVLEAYANQYDVIKIINIPITATYNGNKKNALSLAIKTAKNEHLVFTDADCMPFSNEWISEISSKFSSQKQLILGYGGYDKKPGWLNKLIRFETLMTASQYFSYAISGIPYMGVGRNIAYTKSLFVNANGFQSHNDVQSGDDDLFVNQIAVKENTLICWEKNSQTTSQPKNTLSEWLHQKKRHITTASSYKFIHKILLGLFYLSQLLFYILAIALLFTRIQILWVLLLFGIRLAIFYLIIAFTAKKLNETDLIIWSPFLELFLILMQFRTFISNLLQKPTQW